MVCSRSFSNIGRLKWVSSSFGNYFHSLHKSNVILIGFSLIIAALALLFIDRIQTPIYVEWYTISILQWLRHLASLLLSMFLPGFLFLGIIAHKKREGPIYVMLFSYLLSVFLVTLVYVIVFLSSGYWVSTTPLIDFNVLLFACWILRSRGEINCNISLKFVIAILLLVLLFIGIMRVHDFFIIGDQRDFNGGGTVWLRQPFPSLNSLSQPFYPWWLTAYVSILFASSSLPSTNVYVTLTLLNIMPIIAYYGILDSVVGKRRGKIALVASFLAFASSGFGWLGFFFSNNSMSTADRLVKLGMQTYDIFLPNSFISGNPDITTPLLLLGLPSFLGVVWVSIKKENLDLSDYSLTFFLTALCYLSHTEVGIVLIAVYSLLTLFRKSMNMKLKLSFLSGLMLVSVIDLISPAKYYNELTVSFFGYSINVLFAGIIFYLISFLTSSAIFIRLRLKRILAGMFRKPANRLDSRKWRLLIALSIIYLYFLIIFIYWNFIFSIFTLPSGLQLVPWYMYPIRLGMLGVLALAFGLGCILWRWHRNENLPYILLLGIPAVVILGRLSVYSEFRMMKYLPLFLAPFAAMFTYKFLYKLTNFIRAKSVRNSLRIFTIVLIILLSMPSMLMFFQYEVVSKDPNHYTGLARRLRLSEDKLDALKFLYGSNNETMVNFPRGYANHYSPLIQFSGASGTSTNAFLPLFAITQPEDFFTVANDIELRHLYLDTQDQYLINKLYKDSIVNSLTKVVPMEFQNNETTIYKIPQLSPPSETNYLAIAKQELTEFIPLHGLLENEELTNWTIWTNEYSQGRISEAYNPVKNGNRSLELRYSASSGTQGEVNFMFDSSALSDLSDAYATSFWIFGDNSNITLSIFFIEQWPDHFKHTDIMIDFYGWKKIIIPIDGMQQTVGWDNKAKWIQFNPGFLGDGKEHYLYLDDIRILRKPSSPSIIDYNLLSYLVVGMSHVEYTNIDARIQELTTYNNVLLPIDPTVNTIQNYASWVQTGGHLIVFASNGLGTFSHFIGEPANETCEADSIEGDIASVDFSAIQLIPLLPKPQTEILAFYSYHQEPKTGFIYRTTVGKGVIDYVYLSPLFSKILSANNSEFSTITSFAQFIVEALNLKVNKPLQKTGTTIVPPRYIMGETNFFGNLTISSDYLTFQAYDAHIQNSFEPSLNFQSKIAALTAYGPVNVSISQLKGVINSSESLHITSENKTLGITIHLLEDSQLIIQSINPIKQITLIGPDEITVKATLSPKDAFFLDSHFTSIKIEGKISFGKAYGVWPISNYLLAGDRINIIGTVSFKTKFAEQLSYTYLEDEGRAFYISSDQQTLIYLTNLTLSGTTIQDLYFGGNSVASDELSLPWVEIFTSYWNILLLTLMIIPIVILQILKKSRRLQQQPSMQLQKNKF